MDAGHDHMSRIGTTADDGDLVLVPQRRHAGISRSGQRFSARLMVRTGWPSDDGRPPAKQASIDVC